MPGGKFQSHKTCFARDNILQSFFPYLQRVWALAELSDMEKVHDQDPKAGGIKCDDHYGPFWPYLQTSTLVTISTNKVPQRRPTWTEVYLLTSQIGASESMNQLAH